MVKWMNKSHLGWGISIASFLVIMIVDQTVYAGVWPSTLPVILLVTHAHYFREEVKKKRRVPYLLFALLFFTILYFSLPKFTYDQAEKIVMGKYEIMNEKEQIMPVTGSGFYPFAHTHFYSFNIKSMDVKQRVIVNPDTGEIIVLH